MLVLTKDIERSLMPKPNELKVPNNYITISVKCKERMQITIRESVPGKRDSLPVPGRTGCHRKYTEQL